MKCGVLALAAAVALLLAQTSAAEDQPKAAAPKTEPPKADPAKSKAEPAKPEQPKPAQPQADPVKNGEFTREHLDFFESKIRPILVEHCQKCHGSKEHEAGLRLDSRELAMRGGDSGKAIIPGKPEESPLLKAVRYDGGTQMPPDKKLPPELVEALAEWVRLGAPWPAHEDVAHAATAGAGVSSEAIAKTRSEHWAFKPVAKPPLPAVRNKAWPRGAIDYFVLQKLEAANMTPAPVADRRTLIRRASFDLLGLPPTAEEVAAFESDKSPEAYARLIDRLLASPHYGERWGRYWLDVARYSDTKGYVFQEERKYPFAYTYRDWVIRALNEDLPYDQFLTAQIAADRLELGEDKRPLAAMGFLTVGRRFLNNTHDIIDDRIDVVMRGTQALTVACARCHDHKFDPIPARDYYALYGVFASSQEPKELPQIEMVTEKSKAQEKYEAELAKREKTLNEFVEKQRKDLIAKDPKREKELADERALERAVDRPAKNQIRDLRKKVEQWKANSPAAPAHAMVLVDAANPGDHRILKRGNPGTPGEVAPRKYLEVLAGAERPKFEQGSGRLELARSIASRDNPLTARVAVNRIWMNHFGKGLVTTPSDFGVRSDPPSHPELLDYLAHWLMDHGWSLKQLHREIMLSQAYQQSSQAKPEYIARDPDNRLLSHFNRRRLDFEALRDSLLAAAGQLDETVYGRSVDLTTRPFATRRTVYGFVDRQNLEPLFRTFDFASPDSTSPQRYTTTVPQQALFMMNSPFVVEQTRKLLARPEVTDARNAEERVRELYRLTYGRLPDNDELKLALGFVGADPGPTAPPPRPPAIWQYGYGEVDEGAGKTKQFQKLPHFTGQAYQGGGNLPDGKLGWAILNAEGGHPGQNPQFAVIRRWTAPRAGLVSVTGKLQHPAKEGDGVRGRVLSSRLGKLGEWTAHSGEQSTEIKELEVQAGDMLDFVVDCRTNESHDSFHWAPQVRFVKESAPPPAGSLVEWNARDGFSGPDGEGPPPARLSAWERYAQALLLANEFVFVD